MKKTNTLSIILLSIFVFSCSKNQNDGFQGSEVNEIVKGNVILIIADDFGLDASVGYSVGNQKPNMPVILNLIDNGITFNNVWSNPVCTPTRATILTGKYGYRTEVLNVNDRLSENESTIFNYLNQNTNYSSALIGKWHLAGTPPILNHPNSLGVEFFSGIIGGGVQDYFNWTLNKNGVNENVNQYTTSKLTDEAINWIGNQEKEWFLWLAYNAPHTPFHLAPLNLHSLGQLPSDQASIDENPIPYYFSMLEAMDSEIGRLLSSLDSDELEKTTILFVGDNGTPNPVSQQYNSRRVKGTLYQGGINVPMIISGFQANRSNAQENSLINLTDLFTTILKLCGMNISNINDSKSFYNLLNSASSQEIREYVYSELGQQNFTIRNKTHKYISFDDGTEALFNLNNNPFERPNLLNANQLPLTETNQNILEDLKNKLFEIRN